MTKNNDNKYFGNYLGIVVQNNDPEHRGRVKVFIPHVNCNIYNDWNADFVNVINKNFVFPDFNTNPDLDKILPYLKQVLPWAEVSSPIFGGSASGRYNAYTKKGSTSDSNYWDGDEYVEGFRPSQVYVNSTISDAFTSNHSVNNRFSNPGSNQYIPSDYSNLARGQFSVPNIGAHLWLFFIEGDPNYPVAFATSNGEEDWRRIYSLNKKTEDPSDSILPDYPASYENLAKSEMEGDDPSITHDQKTFRSKHVWNSNKHTIELIDTDLAEVLKLTHYSGSFFEMNNSTNITLATNNDQKLVIGDQFLTVKKNQSLYIASSQDNIIQGDRFIKIGNFKKKQYYSAKIFNLLKDIHEYKLLFEIMRTGKSVHTSSHQKKKGTHAKCPVCGGSGKKFLLPCVTCGGSGKSPSTQWGNFTADNVSKWISGGSICINKWTGMPGVYCNGGSSLFFNHTEYSVKKLVKQIRDAQKEIIDNDYEALLENGGDDIETIAGNRVTTIGTVFNDLKSYRIDPIGKIRDQGVHIGKTGTYVSMAECPLVEYVDVDSIPGGDWDITVCNKFRLNVGSKGITIKTTGPLDIYGTIVNLEGESINIASKHEVLIEGTKRVDVRGDIICLKPGDGNRGYVLADGNLGVRNNLTVVGGAFVEGELTFLHLTAPWEWYNTEIGYGPRPHTHRFKAPAWTLKGTCTAVRSSAQAVNKPSPQPNGKCSGFWVPA